MTNNNNNGIAESNHGPFLTPEAFAEMLDVSTSTLSSWRYKGTGPAYLKITGGLVRYDRETVLAWARSAEVAA
ncbi:helix-turn-helix transcriptional regulator [Homoserinimonas sp. A520]